MTTTKKYIFLYKTFCESSGKVYVGVHSTNKLEDGYIGCGIHRQADARLNVPLHKAVRKHGYSSFRREIISFFDTYDKALIAEANLVNYDWIRSRKNYNVAIGGKLNIWSWITKEQILRRRNKISNSRKGVKLSESHRAALSNSSARYWAGKKRPKHVMEKLHSTLRGKKLSKEHREKLSKAHIGNKPSNVKPIIQYDINGRRICEYESVVAASRSTGFLRTSISNNLTGYRKKAGGYIFKYMEAIA